jgi:tRNA splicing endonuclease
MHFVMVEFLGLSDSFEEQHHRAADRSDVDGLESGVQDQYRLLHDRGFTMNRRGKRGTTFAVYGRQDAFVLPTSTIV